MDGYVPGIPSGPHQPPGHPVSTHHQPPAVMVSVSPLVNHIPVSVQRGLAGTTTVTVAPTVRHNPTAMAITMAPTSTALTIPCFMFVSFLPSWSRIWISPEVRGPVEHPGGFAQTGAPIFETYARICRGVERHCRRGSPRLPQAQTHSGGPCHPSPCAIQERPTLMPWLDELLVLGLDELLQNRPKDVRTPPYLDTICPFLGPAVKRYFSQCSGY